MKGIAGAFLIIAALTYAVTLRAGHDRSSVPTWVGYVRAAAEAGMVGGLADWFAVTALFRRPLGLPIPHTAIIPTRKDAIGQSLGDFVGTNFLAEDVIRDRLRRADLAGRAGAWLTHHENSERVTAELANLVRAGIGILRDEDVQAVLDQAITQRLAAIPAGPPLGRLLGELVADGAHRGLVDLTVDNVHTWLLDNRDAVVEVVARQAPAWSPRFVDTAIAERVYFEVLRVTGEVRAQPDHPLRASFDTFLTEFSEKLRSDPATQERIDGLKVRLLEHPEVRRAVGEAGGTMRRLLLEAVDDPASELRVRVSSGLTEFGGRLVEEPDLRDKINGWAEDVIAHVTTNYSAELTTVITDTVQRWDGVETARKIELQVGRDLQFIRINGTVVGALAGLAIQAITQVIS
jgi:uncharacterized membrane-anchored protein YjiN (DUF445 family)